MAEYFERFEKQILLSEAQFNTLYSLVSAQGKPDAHGKMGINDIIYCQPLRALKRGILPMGQVKIRSYNASKDDDVVYLELKTAIDSSVFKRRIPVSYKSAKLFLKGYEIDELKSDPAFRELDYVIKKSKLYPARFISRDRIAFEGTNWRISFDANIKNRDFDLDFEHGREGDRLFPPRLYLMNIRSKGGIPKWLENIISTLPADDVLA